MDSTRRRPVCTLDFAGYSVKRIYGNHYVLVQKSRHLSNAWILLFIRWLLTFVGILSSIGLLFLYLLGLTLLSDTDFGYLPVFGSAALCGCVAYFCAIWKRNLKGKIRKI